MNIAEILSNNRSINSILYVTDRRQEITKSFICSHEKLEFISNSHNQHDKLNDIYDLECLMGLKRSPYRTANWKLQMKMISFLNRLIIWTRFKLNCYEMMILKSGLFCNVTLFMFTVPCEFSWLRSHDTGLLMRRKMMDTQLYT
jgi:hypothetical protein